MTYLELVQAVARESGTYDPDALPPTTVAATGRDLTVCQWVTEAYVQIQTEERTWRWMEAEFSGQTIASVQSYDAAAMGIADRFSRWIARDSRGESLFSTYLTATGQSDEGFLEVSDWEDFRRDAMVGAMASQTGKPSRITVAPDRKLYLYYTPDDAYTVRGRYYKAPQILSGDVTEPEMPQEHHRAIVWRALRLMGTYDEATTQFPLWSMWEDSYMSRLRQDQMPQIMLSGAFA
jgi:hypothetical protein